MIRRLLVPALAILALAGLGTAGHAQDASEFVLRLNRMEGQMRTLSGQVEQLQFENRQLKEQLRKFQEDVEFRFQERGGRSAAPATQPSTSSQTPGSGTRPGRRSDAFDPETSPSAPGAPRQLGSTQPSAPLPPDTRSPSSAARGGIAGLIEDDGPTGVAPLDLEATRRAGPGATANAGNGTRTAPSVAATGSGDSKADYDGAYAYLLQRQYEQAEMGFRQFLQSHPRDKLVPDATYWLGESYLARNRHREAAEQFLKVSTDYGRSTKAPDAMLKLGISLSALGAKDQACATFAELERKYPQAAPSLRQSVEREQRRVRCPT